MAGEQSGYQNFMPDQNTKIRDLEEKQRMLKNQMLLIGQNLIEMREKTNRDIIEIKKELASIKDTTERLSSFLEMASDELQKFAKKDDVEILAKQVRMLRFAGE